MKGVGGCSDAPPEATPGSYRAEVEGYSPFGIPRGEAHLTCSSRDENNLRWKPYF